MQRTIVSVCAVLFLSGLATAAQAQDSKPTAPAAAPPALGVPAMTTPGSPTRPPMMRDRTDFLAQRLNLTEEQKNQVRPIFDEETKQMQEIREKTNAKLKAILTPEQWDRYYRTSMPRGTNAFSSRLQNIVTRTNAGPVVRPVPQALPGPVPATK